MRKQTGMLTALCGMAAAACVSVASADDSAAVPEKQLLAVATPEADRGISGHEPTYFMLDRSLSGEGDYGARFQFSLKFRLLNPEKPSAPTWGERFYFGYTQTSLWDLSAASAPFRDSSYMPELFWANPEFSPVPAWQSLLGLRMGLGHESNGKAGADSRSINIAYVRPTFTHAFDNSGYVLSFSPKVYHYLDRSENPDIADYRGFGDYWFKLRKDDKLQLSAMLRKGTQGGKGSMQLSASYPFRGFLRQLNGDLYVQYFNGYGETILDYNQKLPARLGIGLIVVR